MEKYKQAFSFYEAMVRHSMKAFGMCEDEARSLWREMAEGIKQVAINDVNITPEQFEEMLKWERSWMSENEE